MLCTPGTGGSAWTRTTRSHLPLRVPLAVTDMMMDLTRLLPKALPTTFGTPELVDRARAAGRLRAELLLPPVDVAFNAPQAGDPLPFRERHGVRDGDLLLVTVCRLSQWLKSESLLRTLEMVRELGRELPLRCIIVGDGALRPRLEALAQEVNAALARPAVALAGALLDPRPAYAAADVVIGMGGSALRSMAFGKPVVVVGEQAFSAPFTPENAKSFLYRGLFGRGDGSPGHSRLAADVRAFAEHPERRASLGAFARKFVVSHFAIETVGAHLDAFLRDAAVQPPKLRVTAADGLRTAAVYLRERRFLVPSRDRVPQDYAAP